MEKMAEFEVRLAEIEKKITAQCFCRMQDTGSTYIFTTGFCEAKLRKRIFSKGFCEAKKFILNFG